MSHDRPPIQIRTIRAEVHQVGDHELEVTGRLLDERPGARPMWFGIREDGAVHDMSLTVRVRHPGLVITAAIPDMTAHPYTICRDALPPLQQLVGVSVAHGFTRAVNERFGRQHGCAHLTALVHAMGPAIRQGAGAAFRDEDELPRAERDLWFIDTCQAWRADGPLADRMRAGDLDAIRALSMRKPPE